MADFINEEKVVFGLSQMGISLFSNELQNNNHTVGGGLSLSNLYFPGGLFVNPITPFHVEKEEEEKDPSQIDVTENFDVFIDLVSPNHNNSNYKKNNNNTKTKKKRTLARKLKDI